MNRKFTRKEINALCDYHHIPEESRGQLYDYARGKIREDDIDVKTSWGCYDRCINAIARLEIDSDPAERSNYSGPFVGKDIIAELKHVCKQNRLYNQLEAYAKQLREFLGIEGESRIVFPNATAVYAETMRQYVTTPKLQRREGGVFFTLRDIALSLSV